MNSFIAPFGKISFNLFNQGFMGVPPSKLGFVCKPDMPPHINILFRARPALEKRSVEGKTKKCSYNGIFDGFTNYLEKFENNDNINEDVERVQIESPCEKRFKEIVRKTENKRFENNEKLQECKYIFIKWFSPFFPKLINGK